MQSILGLNPLYLVGTFIGLVLGLVLHEFMHAYVGYRLGDDTAHAQGRISLNPLAHIDPIMTILVPLVLLLAGLPVFAAAKPVPFNPWALAGGKWGAALVAAAGPLTNLVIAAVVGLYLHLVPAGGVAGTLLTAVVAVNVGLFVFNMIPLPPLDGSRVLYAIAPGGLRDIMDTLERAGLAVVFVFVLLMSYTGLGRYLGEVISSIALFLLPG